MAEDLAVYAIDEKESRHASTVQAELDPCVGMQPCKGWLYRSRSLDGAMRRMYCMLVGNIMYEYATQEEAQYHANRPRGQMEIIGVSAMSSPVRGSLGGRTEHRLVFVTRLTTVCQALAASEEERDVWIQAIKLNLQVHFQLANTPEMATQVSSSVIPIPQPR